MECVCNQKEFSLKRVKINKIIKNIAVYFEKNTKLI